MATATEIATLKRLAAGIIRAQGNRFVKELLHEKKLRIGVNKDDFERNLTAAIESGELTKADVETWLNRVEGWGNQHVYLFNISKKLAGDLTRAKILPRVRAAGLDAVWEASTVMTFPDQAQLTSISFDGSVLRVVWQEASPDWVADPDKNYRTEEGLEEYEYRAYRKVEWRAIMRFEAHLEKRLAALFIPNPIRGEEHKAAIVEARRVIALLMDLAELDNGQMNIPIVSRNLDQKNVPTNKTPSPSVKAQKSRLESDDSYVEFAANDPKKAYWEARAIQEVRSAVRTQQLKVFHGTKGVFLFEAVDGLTRLLRVELHGKGHRIRFSAEMDVAEVWLILEKLSTYQ